MNTNNRFKFKKSSRCGILHAGNPNSGSFGGVAQPL